MDPLYLIVTLRPRPACRDEARLALLKLREASRGEDGCELFDFVQESKSPSSWLMIEKWTSRAHWEAHMLSSHTVQFGDVAGELLAEPASIAFYSPA